MLALPAETTWKLQVIANGKMFCRCQKREIKFTFFSSELWRLILHTSRRNTNIMQSEISREPYRAADAKKEFLCNREKSRKPPEIIYERHPTTKLILGNTCTTPLRAAFECSKKPEVRYFLSSFSRVSVAKWASSKLCKRRLCRHKYWRYLIISKSQRKLK